jgi:hypothetical protein
MDELSLFTDGFQKKALDVNSEDGKKYASMIINSVTHINVHSIKTLDRVMDRAIHVSKASSLDNYFIVNDHYIINIEIQYMYLTPSELSDKSQYYLSMMMSVCTNKGQTFGELYEYIQIILFNGSISKDNQFIIAHELTSKNHTNYQSKLNCYVLQFSKLKGLFQRNGIKRMSEIERMCFYMKYKNNKKYQKELEEILEQDSQVQYLERVFEIFQSDPLFYLETMSAMAKEKEYEHRGIKKGRSEGRLEAFIEMINDGLITIEQAASKLNMSVEKMNKLIRN